MDVINSAKTTPYQIPEFPCFREFIEYSCKSCRAGLGGLPGSPLCPEVPRFHGFGNAVVDLLERRGKRSRNQEPPFASCSQQAPRSGPCKCQSGTAALRVAVKHKQPHVVHSPASVSSPHLQCRLTIHQESHIPTSVTVSTALSLCNTQDCPRAGFFQCWLPMPLLLTVECQADPWEGNGSCSTAEPVPWRVFFFFWQRPVDARDRFEESHVAATALSVG